METLYYKIWKLCTIKFIKLCTIKFIKFLLRITHDRKRLYVRLYYGIWKLLSLQRAASVWTIIVSQHSLPHKEKATSLPTLDFNVYCQFKRSTKSKLLFHSILTEKFETFAIIQLRAFVFQIIEWLGNLFYFCFVVSFSLKSLKPFKFFSICKKDGAIDEIGDKNVNTDFCK